MSILETPRIYFRGEISWDPVTTNNYAPTQAPAAYDEDDCESTLNAGTVGSANVDAFRQAAINEVASAGSWNPDGTYRSQFYDTQISGVDTGSGLDTDDPFVTAPVNFIGMLVDCEPYGAVSSQLFFDDMSFGIAGGCRIYGQRMTRYSDRYINFFNNPSNAMIAGVASVMWQTVFPKDAGLEIDSHDSSALQALEQAMGQSDVLGAMVRWTSYRTIYYDDGGLSNGSPATQAAAQALQQKLNLGGFQPNPARSLIVGTVGLWRQGECPTEPSDRTLVATLAAIPGQTAPSQGGPAVGTVFARVSDNAITLDMSNAMPCSDRDANKIDIGALTLTAADPPPAVAIEEVATIGFDQYDKAAFEATSGIVEIPLDEGQGAQLAQMDLAISGPDGTGYVQEDALRALPDQPNLYIDQGDQVNSTVQVYERGAPAGSGIAVTMSPIGSPTTAHLTLTTDSNGQVQFPLSGSSGNVVGLVFQTGDNPNLPVQNLNTQTMTYMYLRILPADSQIASMQPTWDNVHNYVLSNWEAMAPCMDNWLRLGDETQVTAYAPIVKQLTDPGNFESFRYMPVTRDLTPGMRSLLYAFLDGTPEGEMEAMAATAEETKGEIDFAALSRAQRSG